MSSPWSSLSVISATIFQIAAAAYLKALLLALLDCAADHESRGDFGFIEVERGEEGADLLGHLAGGSESWLSDWQTSAKS